MKEKSKATSISLKIKNPTNYNASRQRDFTNMQLYNFIE